MVKPFSPFSFFALEIAIFKGLFLKTPVMSTETFRAVFAVGAAVVGFYLYFFLSASEKVKHLFRDPGPDGGMSMSFFVFSKPTDSGFSSCPYSLYTASQVSTCNFDSIIIPEL